MKNGFAAMLSELKDKEAGKLAAKIPQWSAVEIEIPASINLEQCSSSSTASYKADVAECILADAGSSRKWRIADLTGGLGVDCWAFSRISEAVLHNERDARLSDAVKHNFARLGVGNAEFSAFDASSEEMLGRLHEFRPNMIFIDPARRSAFGSKVFLLEDCCPNVLGMLPSLMEICPLLMLKLSPMADISMIAGRIGKVLREVHVVGLDGECKELLCILDREHSGDYRIVARDLTGSDISACRTAGIDFSPEEESSADAVYAAEIGDFQESAGHPEYLFVPSAVLMKAGAFKLICGKFSLRALSANSHLYISESASTPLGKSYRILEILPLSGRTLKDVGKRYPAAEVTARGVHMKSEELRSRLGVRPGKDIHIFAASAASGSVLIVTSVLEP